MHKKFMLQSIEKMTGNTIHYKLETNGIRSSASSQNVEEEVRTLSCQV